MYCPPGGIGGGIPMGGGPGGGGIPAGNPPGGIGGGIKFPWGTAPGRAGGAPEGGTAVPAASGVKLGGCTGGAL